MIPAVSLAPRRGRYVQEITQAELESLFHLPSEQACLQLRIGESGDARCPVCEPRPGPLPK